MTRRAWKKPWVQQHDLVQAWSTGPHRGGKKIGVIKILSIERQEWMPWAIDDEEAMREGFTDPGELADVLARAGVEHHDLIYRIEFEFRPENQP